MYNDKSPLPGGRLAVDSPHHPPPQPVCMVVGLYIDRCINLLQEKPEIQELQFNLDGAHEGDCNKPGETSTEG